MKFVHLCLALLLALMQLPPAAAQAMAERAVDIPTRPGVTQRVLLQEVPAPKATLLLLPGGHGGLQLQADASMRWGAGNFLVRSRQALAAQGFNTVVVDAPSDKQSPPYLSGQRQRPDHVADLKAVMAWARGVAAVPVWLVGTSRGTQSAAFVATALQGAEGPDGVVLTASILVDPRGRPVTDMALERIRVPVLVVHHVQDGCVACPYALAQPMVEKLVNAPRKALIAIEGGQSRGDPCEAFAYHGFHGMEQGVVRQMAEWVVGKR